MKKRFERNVARESKSKSIRCLIKVKLLCKGNIHFTELEFIDEKMGERMFPKENI